ncbi:anti-sigma factor [Nonlabens mediterrranea]|uniref:Anti-sigma factor n=1 Tax=Nonlabens mediterrranea TaxID=1419947 RepID=A0ABS0A3A2_9FLAO|nr:anti-sigma factor [Nonlabens mediterrranea]
MKIENQHIEEFLQSGLLDRYVIGDTSDGENIEVENMIAQHPEVQSAYNQLQDELYLYANLNAVTPPEYIKEQLLNKVLPLKEDELHYGNHENWLSIAAAIVALLALSGLGYLYQQNSGLKQEIVETTTQFENLERDYELNDTQKRILELRLAFIEAGDTEKYLMRGYIKDEPLRVIAYYNQPAGKAQIEIAALPPLEAGQDYQLWADVDGEMVSLAVLNDLKPKTISAEILKKASDLNITIEKAGGSKQASVENLVSSIPLNTIP